MSAPRPPAWSAAAHPTPLAPEEESLPAAAALARRFNPAMALPTDDVWPVEVRYAWSDGADVVANVMAGRNRVLRSYVAVPNAALETRPWDDLPTRDEEGRRIRYTVDAPGDDSAEGARSRWRARFAERRARFRPTQYAHLFWYNRERGLLGIQYWFFYPFNEWVNRHEGDWEHVNVLLRGPSALAPGVEQAFTPVGYQFHFHTWRLDTEDVIRVGGADGDHVVVFAGGPGRFLWWGGNQSGASYPLPALWPGAGSGPVKPDEDTRRPARFIGADEFQVILLPEPDRLDARAHPELSWLRLPFYVGQARVARNPPPLDWLGLSGPPLQPARRAAWNAVRGKRQWTGRPAGEIDLGLLPFDWTVIAAPHGARRDGPLALHGAVQTTR